MKMMKGLLHNVNLMFKQGICGLELRIFREIQHSLDRHFIITSISESSRPSLEIIRRFFVQTITIFVEKGYYFHFTCKNTSVLFTLFINDKCLLQEKTSSMWLDLALLFNLTNANNN